MNAASEAERENRVMFGDPFGNRGDYSKGIFYGGRRSVLSFIYLTSRGSHHLIIDDIYTVKIHHPQQQQQRQIS